MPYIRDMNTHDLKGVFGRRLRHLRQSRDLTQAALSERIGISLDYLSKIERGLASPSFFVIEKLSRHFQISPAVLFLSPRDFAAGADQEDGEAAAYRALAFMHCVDPIFIASTEAIIVDANTVAEREFGWQARELLGRPLLSLVAADCLAYVTEIVSLCGKGTDLRNARASLLARDGKHIPVMVSVTLLRDKKNTSSRIVFVAKTMPAGG